MSKIAPNSHTPSNSNMSHLAIKSGKSHEETYESIVKGSGGQEESWPSNLIRAPSLPPRVDGMNEPGRRKSNMNTSSSNLIGAPPVPAGQMKAEEVQDEEVEFSMGKLIRQASLSNSESFPPRRHAAKARQKTPASSKLSRHGSIMKTDVVKLEGPEKTIRPPRLMNQLKTQKSLNDLELYHELQGFKDLGLDSETSPRPDGKKSAEDIKAQIKFWARAVASNVRQES